MAEVTKPIALDESFNTTETTSRNVADVLAEGLDNIAESISPRAATEIPISSGSATNTKDYIDSKVATASGTATAQTGVTIGSKNLVYKQGIFCYICLVLSITSNISAGDNLVKLPFEINTNQYIIARKDDGTTVMLSGNGEYIKTEFAISSGTILRIGDTTLAV